MSKYISFSQLKNWVKCPFYHKLVNIEKVDGAFSGNIYTAFGSALHETIEKHLEEEISDNDLKSYFGEAFGKERGLLVEEIKDNHFDQFKSHNYYQSRNQDLIPTLVVIMRL